MTSAVCAQQPRGGQMINDSLAHGLVKGCAAVAAEFYEPSADGKMKDPTQLTTTYSTAMTETDPQAVLSALRPVRRSTAVPAHQPTLPAYLDHRHNEFRLRGMADCLRRCKK